jgi:O-antigen/teichoic acid export membrane protein
VSGPAPAAPDPVAPLDRRVTRPRTARNVIFSWVAFVVTVAVNFFLSPFVVHRLGNTAYGIWVLLASLVGYMGLLDLGVRSAVTRYVARHHARVEDAEAGKVASAGLVIFSAAGLVAVSISAIVAVLLPHLFTIPPRELGVARVVVILGGLNVALSLVSGVFGGAVGAMQRFDLDALVGIGVTAVRAVLLVVTLSAGGGLLAVALIQLGCTVLQGGVFFGISARLYPELRYSHRGIERAHITKIFSVGIYASLLQISSALIFSADSMVIGSFLPVAAVTFFAIAATLTDYTRSVLSAISQTMTPRASALDGIGAERELERVLLDAGALATLVALPITITFMLRGGTFIGLWMGPSYASSSGAILFVLSVALSLAAARQIVASTMIGVNRHRDLVPFYAAEGLINVGVSLYWVRTIGLLGVALGTAVPNVVTTLLVTPWITHRVLGTSTWRFAQAVWVRPLLAMVPFAAATWAVEQGWPGRSLVTFFAGVLVTLPVAALGAWFVAVPEGYRSTALASLGRMRRAVFRSA